MTVPIPATINANASGVWSERVGESVTYHGPGDNYLQAWVVVDGARRPIVLPRRWIDLEES